MRLIMPFICNPAMLHFQKRKNFFRYDSNTILNRFIPCTLSPKFFFVLVESRIKAVVPGISRSNLDSAVRFAVKVMQQTRDAYHEPVSLLEVSKENDHTLTFIVRTLFTHNSEVFHLECEEPTQ